ncbi:hypothetical protein D3C76_1847420 [compost metagenome]
MAEILNYASNVPTPITNGAAIQIPLTPAGQGIAQVRVNAISIGSQNKEAGLI